MLNFNKNKAFTLIELLVVIAIIGILSSVVLASLSGARESAKKASTQSQLDQLRTAFTAYDIDNKAYPPGGDLFNTGVNVGESCNDGRDEWKNASDALVSGGYLSAPIETDSWGNEYCYDNNYFSSVCSTTYLYSMGPNEVKDTSNGDANNGNFQGDDIGILFSPSCN